MPDAIKVNPFFDSYVKLADVSPSVEYQQGTWTSLVVNWKAFAALGLIEDALDVALSNLPCGSQLRYDGVTVIRKTATGELLASRLVLESAGLSVDTTLTNGFVSMAAESDDLVSALLHCWAAEGKIHSGCFVLQEWLPRHES